MKGSTFHATVLVAVSITLGSCAYPSSEYDRFYPPEWEPHRSVVIEFDNDDAMDRVSVQVAAAISHQLDAVCLIQGDSLRQHYLRLLVQEGADTSRVRFMSYPGSQAFSARDHQFFLRSSKGSTLMLADFAWVEYGYYYEPFFQAERMSRNARESELLRAEFARWFAVDRIESKLVLEGGAFDVNGKGTVLVAESVNMHRNPEWSREQQETEMKRMLGVRHVLWMKEGPADDPHPIGNAVRITENYFGSGVGGHIDEFVRFIDSATVLLLWPDSLEALQDPVLRITRERMIENRRILESSTDQDGHPLKIILLPSPRETYVTARIDTASSDPLIQERSQSIVRRYSEFAQGDTVHFVPASSYANYLVTNGLVLIPKYWRPGLSEKCRQRDEEAKQIIGAQFPGRTVVQIDALPFNWIGGGIHCWTQQVPR